MLIPGVSPFPIYTSVIPLAVILTVTAVKEAREDYLRHQQDYVANSTKYYVLQFDETLRNKVGRRRTNRSSVVGGNPLERQHSYSATSISHNSFSRNSAQTTVEVNTDIKLPPTPAGCKWVLKPSREILVGDIVCILDSQEFPCDIVAFSSARVDKNCYINTANLDGEAVPKLRRTLDAKCWLGEMQCPEPSTTMSSFNAVAKLYHHEIINQRVRNMEISADQITNLAQIEEYAKNQHPELANDPQELANVYMKTSSLTISNLLMRGASLANTPWIVGSVCYTGKDTKMMMNRAPAKVKFSNFEQMLNRFIWGILLLNFIACMCLSIASVLGEQTWSKVYDIDSDGFVQWIKNFCTLYVLFSWMLPISLYVTIELVRVFQSMCMEWDVGFKLVIQVPNMENHSDDKKETDDEATDNVHLDYTEVTRMLKVNNSGLIEEFGHVNYIFTDKTGTLTYNQMELAAITVDHNTYMHEIQRDGADTTNQQPATGIRTLSNKGNVNTLIELSAHHLPLSIVADHHKNDKKTLLSGVSTTSVMFFLNILLNNDVNPSHRGHDQALGWTFMSQSPDEVALCEALRDCGLLLINKTNENASILLSTDIINQIEKNLKNKSKVPVVKTSSSSPSGTLAPLPSPGKKTTPKAAKKTIDQLKADDSDDESSENVDEALTKKKIGFEVLNLFANNDERDSDDENDHAAHDPEPSYTKNVAVVPEEAMLYYTINAMLDFTSARRRSTIIATCPITGVYYLLTKGADSTILPMCRESDVLEETKKVMRQMSSTGARTLVFAGQVWSKDQYNDFMTKYKTITEGMSADRDQEIEDLFISVEKRLDCLGASAVLDQIQDGARSTVEKLLDAGIGVTVVTGDKRETAVSIGKESAIVPDVADLIFTYEQLPEFISVRNVSHSILNRDDSDNQWQQHLKKLKLKSSQAPGAFMGRKDKDKLGTPGHTCTNSQCFRVCSKDSNLYLCGETAHLIVDNIEYKINSSYFTKVGQKYTCMEMPPEEEEAHSVHKWTAEDIILKAVTARNNGGYNLDAKYTFAVEKGADNMEDWYKVPIEVCSMETKQHVKVLSAFFSVYRCAHAACGLPSLDSLNAEGNNNNGIEMGKLGRDTNPLYTVERSDVSLPVSVCISGDFMEIALTQHTPLGMMLLSNVKSVVAYRCAPRQKQLIVAAVKNQGNVCIAIGDGANDVSMIQESSIGVGILGKEGAHAALSSDIVVYRFHHLQRLVLYHGRYNFHRNGLIVLLAFYKNFVFVLPVVWYSFMNKFSGQILTLSYFMSVYNLFLTSLPLFSLGLLDMDIPGHLATKIPVAYKKFQSEHDFHLLGLCKWLLLASIQSVITFIVLVYGMFNEGIDSDGRNFDLWGPGNMSTLAVVILVNIVLLFDCLSITWINILFCILGILAFFAVYAVFTFGNLTSMAPEGFGVLQATFGVPKMWFFTLCVVGAGLVPYIAWRSYRMLFPTFAGRIREHAKLHESQLVVPVKTDTTKNSSQKQD